MRATISGFPCAAYPDEEDNRFALSRAGAGQTTHRVWGTSHHIFIKTLVYMNSTLREPLHAGRVPLDKISARMVSWWGWSDNGSNVPGEFKELLHYLGRQARGAGSTDAGLAAVKAGWEALREAHKAEQLEQQHQVLEERTRLLKELTALASTFRKALPETFRMLEDAEAAFSDEFVQQGLEPPGGVLLPVRLFNQKRAQYYEHRVVKPPGVPLFNADAMPKDDEIDRILEEQLRKEEYAAKTVAFSYTGIAFVLATRWATYRQGRSIFTRMLAWWHVAGDDASKLGEAVTRLEEAAMRVKAIVLKRPRSAFDNRAMTGGVW